MKILLVLTIACLLFTAGESGSVQSSSNPNAKTPVLVELFTSEGCSSCPPADALLQKLDLEPVAGEDIIVLSEHVDYWNHIGWKDPYSARFFSDRQGVYAKRLGLPDVYTPQMVVDGNTQFLGSDAALAEKALAKASTQPKVSIRLSGVSSGATNLLLAHLEAGALPESFGLKEAVVYVALALNHTESEVSHGENAGRTLAHTAVARSIVKVGGFRKQQTFVQDIQLKIESGTDVRNLRLIAFVQEQGQGRVIGVTAQRVGTAVAGN